MIVEFDRNTHSYSVNGELATISITTLLNSQGITPDYSKVNIKVLQEKAEFGDKVHNDIDNYYKGEEINDLSNEATQFINYVEENEIKVIDTELRLGLIYKGVVIAGTCDFIGLSDDGIIIADHKTTSTIHKDSVSWQVSLYDYMLRNCKDEYINDHNIKFYTKADKFYCYWYNKGEFKIIELQKIPDVEIEKLLDCFINGEKYQKQDLIIANDLKMQIEQAEQYLAEIEISYKNAKKQAEDLRQQLITLMEEQQVKSWETENFKITYIAPQERETVDTKLLKEINTDVYNACLKTSKIKAGVRITIKNNF